MEHYGIVSLLPPVIAVILAIKTKNVISSLFWAGLVGVFVLCGYNPIQVLPTYIKDYVFVQAADGYNSSLLVMMVFIGGFVGVVTGSGGPRYLLTKWLISSTPGVRRSWSFG
ncbi:MAG: hypothetical protein LUG14_02730 [Synergistaceae bacterium]|nr:hypothetical protein [Synergistaceae bacterium]